MLLALLSLIAEVGMPTIEARGRALAELVHAGLQRQGEVVGTVSSPDPARRSAIITFPSASPAGDEALVQRLAERRIVVALRPLGARVSPHFYTTEDRGGGRPIPGRAQLVHVGGRT